MGEVAKLGMGKVERKDKFGGSGRKGMGFIKYCR
jgi:hypothetical protein